MFDSSAWSVMAIVVYPTTLALLTSSDGTRTPSLRKL